MTTKTIQINSDITGRIKRILQGVEFDGKLTFITELLQNTQRAKATVAHMTLDGDTFTLKDNGFGCEDPKNLFTLDFSGFGYGFGEGFSSVYTLLGQVNVRSLNWAASIDVERLASKRTIKLEDLEVPIRESDFYQGFIVELKSERLDTESYYIRQEIRKVASTIKEIDFYLNGELLPKVDLFEIPKEVDFYERIDNSLYEAIFHLDGNLYDTEVKFYYDNRFVMNQNYPFYGLNGNLLIKPNKANLKAPDRTSIIYDDKRDRLMNRIEKDFEKLLIRVLKEGTTQQIEKYASVIQRHLPVEKYMRYLQIDEALIKNQFEVRQELVEDVSPTASWLNPSDEDDPIADENDFSIGEPIESDHRFVEGNEWDEQAETQTAFAVSSSDQQLDLFAATDFSKEMDQPSVFEAVANHQSEATHLLGTNFGELLQGNQANLSLMEQVASVDVPEEQDLRRHLADKSFTSYVDIPKTERVSKEELSTVNLTNIKRKSNVIWVEQSKVTEYESKISQYEYYGLFTFLSPHVLYDEALKHLGITHVSEVEYDAIEKRYSVKNIHAKSKKEMRAMELLQRIEKLFGLSDTFYISDIECKMFVNLNAKQIYQEKLSVEGYAQGNSIHLNRKSLHFGKLSSLHLGKSQWGMHDIKFILANLELIVHELAHRVHYTSDNTVEHYEAMLKVQEVITQHILNNES